MGQPGGLHGGRALQRAAQLRHLLGRKPPPQLRVTGQIILHVHNQGRTAHQRPCRPSPHLDGRCKIGQTGGTEISIPAAPPLRLGHAVQVEFVTGRGYAPPRVQGTAGLAAFTAHPGCEQRSALSVQNSAADAAGGGKELRRLSRRLEIKGTASFLAPALFHGRFLRMLSLKIRLF